MAFDPSDPHARRSVVGRAALHGAMSAALTAGALHMVGSQDFAPAAVAGAVGAAVGAHGARRHNRETDAYEAQHGSGPAQRSVVGRTLLHGAIGGWGGAALGAAADHVLGTHGISQSLGTLGQLGGYVHGYRSAKRHNAMVDALVAARAKKQTVGGAVKNAQFEAKHRRIHGRFT